MAIDYGTKRTGIAVSDPARIIAGGLDTIPTSGLITWIGKYMAAEEVDIIVVGRPVQSDGSPSDTFAAARALDANIYASFSDGYHRVSFDEVVQAMKETGHDLPSLYKETGEGGLAAVRNSGKFRPSKS